MRNELILMIVSVTMLFMISSLAYAQIIPLPPTDETGNVTVFVQIPFAVTNSTCIDNSTLNQVSYGIVNNQTINSEQEINCNYGCDPLNNVCNPSPTTQNFVFVGAVLSIFIIIILVAVWLVKRR